MKRSVPRVNKQQAYSHWSGAAVLLNTKHQWPDSGYLHVTRAHNRKQLEQPEPSPIEPKQSLLLPGTYSVGYTVAWTIR